jgi:hypothetical protein
MIASESKEAFDNFYNSVYIPSPETVTPETMSATEMNIAQDLNGDTSMQIMTNDALTKKVSK